MTILLDESLPRRLKEELAGHEVSTVPEMGWAGLQNGDLLSRATRSFEVFITADQNLEYQHRLAEYDIATIVLAAKTSRLDDLRPLVPELLKVVSRAQRGNVYRVHAE